MPTCKRDRLFMAAGYVAYRVPFLVNDEKAILLDSPFYRSASSTTTTGPEKTASAEYVHARCRPLAGRADHPTGRTKPV